MAENGKPRDFEESLKEILTPGGDDGTTPADSQRPVPGRSARRMNHGRGEGTVPQWVSLLVRVLAACAVAALLLMFAGRISSL